MSSRERQRAYLRGEFAWFTRITTRWHDNDVFGHVNNVVYYSWFDTAVNQWLIESGALNPIEAPLIGLVAETSCVYFKSLAFPDAIDAGLGVHHIGTSSVEYQIGIFKSTGETSRALGRFVHVYVDRETRKPSPLPAEMRKALEKLVMKA